MIQINRPYLGKISDLITSKTVFDTITVILNITEPFFVCFL